MLERLQRSGRALFEPCRRLLDRGVGGRLNPFHHLGALTIYFFWIVLVSGIWLFIFFRTSVDGAYESVEYLTHEQWYLGGVMRSLHRYASDAAIISLALHMFREFVYDRHRGARWFSWVTGVPLLWLVIPLGITGYWLVWDQLGWYVALISAELLDWLPIFTDSMARNFLSADVLSNRFFTLMAFMHLIGFPLFLVFGIWLHVLRLNGPQINPPRALMAASLVALTLLSLVHPALSQGPVDMSQVPARLGMDWYYLLVYPLVEAWSPGWVWGLLVGFSLLLCALPWLPPPRARPAAVVDLDNCNGCERCAEDCPFSAITMMPRSDGKAYESEAVVDPSLCVSCGLCVGACPTATPFRRHGRLVPGIDLPELPAATLRETLIEVSEGLKGDRRILVLQCRDNPRSGASRNAMTDTATGVVDVVCVGQLPPPFVDFILSRDLADGVVLAGCPGGDCQYRFGADWTELRAARERDPHLRKRVDTGRLALSWKAPWSGSGDTAEVVSALRRRLGGDRQEPKNAVGAKARSKAARYLIPGAAGLAALGVVGSFSAWPRLPLRGPDEAMVSLSFSHAGESLQECRRLSQEELQQLPPNMRNPLDCPRGRHPLKVVFAVDGERRYEATLPPSGFWDDGAANVYGRHMVPAGEHTLFVGMSDDGNSEGFDYSLEKTLFVEPGQHIVVAFDNASQSFFLKRE